MTVLSRSAPAGSVCLARAGPVLTIDPNASTSVPQAGTEGEPAPEFSFADIRTGDEQTLEAFRDGRPALVNFFYLLMQMVIAIEDIGVRGAVRRVVTFLRVSLREIAGIFGVVFVLVVVATIASILGTTGLGLISFVPIVALAVLPLQIAAWLLRGFVFQYLALTALGAYLTQYQHYLRGAPLAAVPGQRLA